MSEEEHGDIQRWATLAGRVPESGVIRCAIYTRRSIRRDDRFSSCGAQWLACWNHVWDRRPIGWWPITSEWYEDDGESGAELARPGLDRLLAAIRERRVDRVVVHRLDRLTRSAHHWAKIAALLLEHRVGLTIVADGIELEDDAFSRLQLNLGAIAAELEREMINERQRDAFRARRGRGLRSGGKLPLGYVADPRTKQLVIEPSEAAVVRSIFADADAGQRPLAIAARLNAGAIADKAGKIGAWSARSVLRILQNPTHAGSLPGGQPGQHEAIVERALFDRVTATIEARRTRQPTDRAEYEEADPYLLRGLLVCAACGRRMTTSSRGKLPRVPERTSAKRVIRDRYYRCRTDGCGASYVPADAAERYIVGVLQNPETGTPADVARVMRNIGVLWDGLFVGNRHRILARFIREIRWDAARGVAEIEFDADSVARSTARNERRNDGS